MLLFPSGRTPLPKSSNSMSVAIEWVERAKYHNSIYPYLMSGSGYSQNGRLRQVRWLALNRLIDYTDDIGLTGLQVVLKVHDVEAIYE